MVRRFPTDENPLVHPAISLSLLAAGMAAAIAMITTLCGVRFRRRSPPSPSSSPTSNAADKQDENASPTPTTNPTSTTTAATTTTTTLSPPPQPASGDAENGGDQSEQPIKELPLPPKMQQVTNSGPINPMAKSASERKLNYHMRSMSIKVPRSLSVVRNRDQKDDRIQRKKEKTRTEESIWTKTIILGEKCKVPDEEDAVIYEGKGKKISAYHPRAPSSMSITMSRQSSFIDPEAIPNQEAK